MFTETYKRDGALMVDAFGVSYPDAFTHPLSEYRCLTTNVALIDVTHWGVIRLGGGDRVRFLNAMVTNDVETLKDGNACHAAMTTVKGKLVAELIILKRPHEFFVLVTQGDTAAVAEALDKHIIADDVSLEDVSAQFGVLSVEGPKSREIVWRVFPDGPLPLEPLAFGEGDYQGLPVTVLRNSVTGEKGMQMIVPADGIELMRNYLVQAGVGMDMQLAGRVAWNMRRIENGLPWFGADVTTDNFPKESRLDDVVNYEKGCYLGQETLARMHYRGHPNWLLVGLAPADASGAFEIPSFFNDASLPTVGDSPDVVRQHVDALLLRGAVDSGEEIFEADTPANDGSVATKAAGRVTSAIVSPALNKPLFLAYVRHKLADGNVTFSLSTKNDQHDLRIQELPLGVD